VKTLVVVAVTLALAVAAPAHARATIVVQKGIAGVELRMTKTQVRARLGTPKLVRTGSNDFGPYTKFVYPRVTVTFQSGPRVTSTETTSPRERTATGVGVGSTEARLKAAVRGVRCMTTLSSRQCVVGTFKPGRIVTAFFIDRSRISSVIVGFVLD
jgi:hypothetical protein